MEIITKISKEKNNVHIYNNSHYYLKETKASLILIENFLGNESKISQVRGWKRYIISKLYQMLNGRDEKERGFRIFLAMKILNNIKFNPNVNNYIFLINDLSYEEVIFWVWQYNSYGKAVINAFKIIHLNKKRS